MYRFRTEGGRARARYKSYNFVVHNEAGGNVREISELSARARISPRFSRRSTRTEQRGAGTEASGRLRLLRASKEQITSSFRSDFALAFREI